MYDTLIIDESLDTLIIDESLMSTLIPALKKALLTQYTDKPKQLALGRIVTRKHAERQIQLLKEVEQDDKAKIITGGIADCDVEDKYIAPTIVVNPASSTRLVKEEIFGHILRVVTVPNRMEALRFMRVMPGIPLCLYVFTSSSAVFMEISSQIPSGSAMHNDCLLCAASFSIPFGGLGTSGQGSYHGRYSFDCFTHTMPVMYRPVFPGADLNMFRYHPYNNLVKMIVTKHIKIPYVPVVRLRRKVLNLAIACMVALVVAQQPHWIAPVLNGIASILEEAAKFLRTT